MTRRITLTLAFGAPVLVAVLTGCVGGPVPPLSSASPQVPSSSGASPPASPDASPTIWTDPAAVFVSLPGYVYVDVPKATQNELERWARTNKDFDAAITEVVVKAVDDGSQWGPVGIMAIGVERPYANLFGLRQALPISIARESGGTLELSIVAHRSTYKISAVAFGGNVTFFTWQQDAVFLVAWGYREQRVESIVAALIEATVGS